MPKATRFDLFLDESGDFKTAGHHCMAVVSVRKEARDLSTAIKDVFHRLGHEIGSFHACSSRREDKLVLFSQLLTNVGACSGSRLDLVAWHATTDQEDDVYPAFLVDTILNVLPFLSKNEPADITLDCRISFEHRKSMNLIGLEAVLQERIKARDPHHLWQFILHNLPKGSHPLLQVADLTANLWYQHLASGEELPEGSPQVTQHQLGTKWPVKQWKPEELQAMLIGVPKDVPIKVIKQKVIERQTVTIYKEEPGPTVVKHALEQAEFCLRELEVHKTSPEADLAFQHRWLERFAKLPPEVRRLELERLTDHLDSLLPQRERAEAVLLLSALIAASAADPADVDRHLRSKYFALRLRAGLIRVHILNHRGVDSRKDRQLEALASELPHWHSDMELWPLLAEFYNRLAVARQNVFDWVGATELLAPMVGYFLEAQQHGPFGQVAYGREIGALVANHGQCCFFQAHRAWFFGQREEFERLENEGHFHTEYAQTTLFNLPEDRERQVVYRAQGLLQRALLFGEVAVATQAEELLVTLHDPAEVFATFLANPATLEANKLFWLIAWLKTRYLCGGKFDLPARACSQALLSLPWCHPFEQLLGYLNLLGVEPRLCRTRLSEPRWESPLVEAIATFFMLQDAWAKNAELDPDNIQHLQKLTASYPPLAYCTDLMKRWPDLPGKGRGPLIALPYNFC